MASGAGQAPPGAGPAGLDIDSDLLRLDRCRHGLFLSLKSDFYIGRSLAEYGEWGEGEIGFLGQLLRPGDVVVDAGANVGTHAVAFARKVGPQGRVYAFEPQPVIHQILAANALINGLGQITPVHAGLSDAPGWIEFPELNYGAVANFGGFSVETIGKLAARAPSPRRQRVATAPLDEILTLDRLRLIKADVEGMESALLKGARRSLERFRPALYLECNDPGGVAPILDALEGLGYRAYWHLTPLFNRENWRGVAEDKLGPGANFNMVCVPDGVNVQGLRPATGASDHPKTLADAHKAAREGKTQ